MQSTPKKIAVTGAAGQICYSLLFRLANGDLNPRQVSSTIRLDHNRALTQLARMAACGVGDIDKLVVWGNHSPTMFADWTYATAAGRPLSETIADDHWYKEVLIPDVARCGTAIIEARGASSAASAANAAIDQMHGTDGRWTSMAVIWQGQYGIPEGLVCGVPVMCEDGDYSAVEGLDLDGFQKSMLEKTIEELVGERDGLS